MPTLESFIHRSNIHRFLDGLSKNPNARSRATLLKLLAAEEDQLAANQQHLELAERWLGEWKARVAQVHIMTAQPLFQGAESRENAELLVTMHSVQGLLEDLCRRLHEALESHSPQPRSQFDLHDSRMIREEISR